jgi:hypothetical protein
MNALTYVVGKSVDSPMTGGTVEDAYTNLAIATVAIAVKDYKTSYKAGNISNCKAIRKFLMNSWPSDIFTNINLGSILDRVETTDIDI